MIQNGRRILWLGLAGVIALLPQAAAADTYTYDQYGRLVSVTFTGGGSITYYYDDAGNRTRVEKRP
jgi:uncharacterized protein RhaS with RHS repeats